MNELKQNDIRGLGRLISQAENGESELWSVLAKVYPQTGRANILGVTGPPGAGKSTLINSWLKILRGKGKTVAVIAVDPVSPFSGGSLLGDRIRLADHFNDSGVYIRSLSTRGKLGGLSLATREVVHLLDGYGFDWILIETVGVGQSEVDIHRIADSSVVVLVPEWGDTIQAMKAGLVEIGDIFLVNKADRGGVERVVTDLQSVLHIENRAETPVMTVAHEDAASSQSAWETIEKFWINKRNVIKVRREARVRDTAIEVIQAAFMKELKAKIGKLPEAGKNPYAFLETLLKSKLLEGLFKL